MGSRAAGCEAASGIAKDRPRAAPNRAPARIVGHPNECGTPAANAALGAGSVHDLVRGWSCHPHIRSRYFGAAAGGAATAGKSEVTLAPTTCHLPAGERRNTTSCFGVSVGRQAPVEPNAWLPSSGLLRRRFQQFDRALIPAPACGVDRKNALSARDGGISAALEKECKRVQRARLRRVM